MDPNAYALQLEQTCFFLKHELPECLTSNSDDMTAFGIKGDHDIVLEFSRRGENFVVHYWVDEIMVRIVRKDDPKYYMEVRKGMITVDRVGLEVAQQALRHIQQLYTHAVSERS